MAFAGYLVTRILRFDEGTDKMREIALAVRIGSKVYLKRQNSIIAVFFGIIFLILLLLVSQGYLARFVPFAFLSGGFFSGLAGFIGMTVATNSASRTANAARENLNSGLRVAFSSGAVMGLVVVGCGLLHLS